MSQEQQQQTHHGLQLPDAGAPPENRLTYDWLLSMIGGMVRLVFNIMALPAEVYLRRPGTIGERYLATPMIVSAFLYLMVFTFFDARDQLPMFDADPGHGTGAFAYLFLLMSAVHWVGIRIRAARGELTHSFSPGLPWRPVMRFVEFILERLVEPAIPKSWTNHGAPTHLKNRAQVVAISYLEPLIWLSAGIGIIGTFGALLQSVWIWTGIALTSKHLLNRYYSRLEVLDLIDQHIEAKHKTALLSGLTTPAAANGYTVWSPPIWPRQQASYREALHRMPDELRHAVTSESS